MKREGGDAVAGRTQGQGGGESRARRKGTGGRIVEARERNEERIEMWNRRVRK